MSTIIQTHHAQNPINIELLNFVNQRGTATWGDLFAAFGDGSDSEKGSISRFNKKMEYLLHTEQLQCAGIGKSRVFSIGPMANKATPARGRVASKAGSVDGSDTPHPYPHLKYLGGVVPPRQHVSTDPYSPPPNTVLRPGAMDYRRYGSHGHQC